MGHNSTSLAEPQQQSMHLARIALIGVSISSPPYATQKRFVSTLLVNFSQSSGAALRSAVVSRREDLTAVQHKGLVLPFLRLPRRSPRIPRCFVALPGGLVGFIHDFHPLSDRGLYLLRLCASSRDDAF